MSRLFHLAAGAVLAACSFSTSIAFAQNQTSPSQPASSPQPVCIYNSGTYSDGAYICAQKSMMQICQVDGMKATWKIVTDKDINDRCLAPAVSSQAPRRMRARRHFTGAHVYSDPSAKCFSFNGKRYCE